MKKKVLFVVFLMLILTFVNASDKKILMRFDSEISPILNNGFVELGYNGIDSLNTLYECNDYCLINYEWATELKNIVILEFDTKKYSIEEILLAYQNINNPDINILEIHEEIVLSVPNEYLYSETKQHQEDVYWRLYGDDDEKRHWRNYAWENSSAEEQYYSDILDRHFLGYGETVNFTSNIYPYHLDDHYSGTTMAFHGKLGMWHHTMNYNDTYRAHNYATGENVFVGVTDPHGHWQHHPDLIDRWVENPLSNMYFNSDNSTQDVFQDRYHGTVCDGAFFASANVTPQNDIDNTSAIGVSPGVKAYAKGTNISSFLNDIVAMPESERPKVISSSHLLGYLANLIVAEMESLDINLIGGRAYGSMSCHNMDVICDSDNAIGVGDYDPDYRVKTYYTDVNKNNSSLYSRVNISAPGWGVWTTSYIPGGGTSEDTEYSLIMGNNTSIAVPQVAGAVALIAEKYPWMNAAQRKQQILNGAHHLDELITASAEILPQRPDYFYGSGCLSVYKSLFLHGNYVHDFIYDENEDNSLLLGRNCTINNSTIYMPSGEIRVLEGSKVSLNNCDIFIGDDVVINIEKGASLTVSEPQSLAIGNGVKVIGGSSHTEQSFTIKTYDGELVLNDIEFEKCSFNPIKTSIAISNSSFNRAYFEGEEINLTVDNCTFDFSSLKSRYYNSPEDNYVIVKNSSFENSNSNAIELFAHRNLKIYNNSLSYNDNAIFLYEIRNGSLYDNSVLYNNNGLYIYHCTGLDVTGSNNISTNYSSEVSQGKGIYATHNSQWSLQGNETSPYQEIRFNNNGNLHFTDSATPYPLRYNKIYSANHNTPYLIIEDRNTSATTVYDAKYNYWGEDFIPEQDLFSFGTINYDPIWNPSSGNGGSYYETLAETAFNEAIDLENQMLFVQAEMKYKEIVTYYSESKFAELAIKNLYNLVEKHNKNYTALEIYLKNDPDLINNTTLKKVADHLAAFCNMSTGDYPQAIEYFESVIDNPGSVQDSLYAVIDATYAYLLMEVSQLKEEKNKKFLNEQEEFEQLVVSLTKHQGNYSENQGDQNITSIENLDSKVYPNPFNPTTTISFNNPTESKVKISIFNIKGQKIKTIANSTFTKGHNTVVWNGDDSNNSKVASGVYFVKITTGQASNIRKIMLMK